MNSLLRLHGAAARRLSTLDLEFPTCVARFTDYTDAQEAVDTLLTWGFPVEQVAIVGHGLRSVERVTGASRPRAATLGAAFGAWFGLFGAISFAFTTGSHRAFFLLTSAVFGALGGLLWAQLEHVLLHRDFTSITQLLAPRYDLTVEHHLADRARELLTTVGPRPSMHGLS